MPPTVTTETTDAEVLRRGGLALVVAVSVNLVLVFMATLASVAPDLLHLDYARVSVFTAVGVAGATATYLALTRVVETPRRTFARLAAGLVVLSMLPTALVIPGEPGDTTLGTVMLGVLHLPPAVASVVLLTGRHEA